MTTELRERLARRLCYTNCEEFGEKSPACPSLKCNQHGLFFKDVDAVLAELSAAGYAVVPKAWLVGSGMTKDERLALKAKGEGHSEDGGQQ